MKNIGTLTFSDLFSGIGGFRLALESFGLRCVFSSEIDSDCSEVYELNFMDKPCGDITHIAAADIPPHDILCAGFPCQPFSIAGKKEGFNDPRGNLFDEIIRIIKHVKPKIILLENVKNLLSHANGSTLTTMVTKLSLAGYDVHYSSLNAGDYGAATVRTRVFIVGFLKRLSVSHFLFPLPLVRYSTVGDIVSPGEIDSKYFVTKETVALEVSNRTRSRSALRVGFLGRGRQGERIYSEKGQAITFSASGGGPGSTSGLYLINQKVRKLTPRECYRAMGFPETFKIKPEDRAAYRQIGNSVAIPVIQILIGTILTELVKNQL